MKNLKVLNQTLNLTAAELTTVVEYRHSSGMILQLHTVQFVSRSLPALALQRMTVTSPSGHDLSKLGLSISSDLVNASGAITKAQASGVALDAEFHPLRPEHMQHGANNWNESVGLRGLGGARVALASSTRQSGSAAAVVVDTYGSVVVDLYHPRPEPKAIGMASAGVYRGFEQLRVENEAAWAEIWTSRIVASGPKVTAGDQAMLDFAVYYLLSSAHPSMKTAAAPYGLTSKAYFGNGYWDWDISLGLPVALIDPRAGIAGQHTKTAHLEAARDNARLFGWRGSFYPTVCSMRDGTDAGLPSAKDSMDTEEHTALDSALAVYETALIALDPDFTTRLAWPLIRDVARFVVSRGVWTTRGFEILGLLGPDESKDKVNNELYEQVQAIRVMEAAVQLATNPKLGVPRAHVLVRPDEIGMWRRVAAQVYLPRLSTTGALLPDDESDVTAADPGACVSCAAACPKGSGIRCACCSQLFSPGALWWVYLHGFPTSHPGFDPKTLNATRELDLAAIASFSKGWPMPAVPTSSAAPFFSTPPFTALAAASGDRAGALELWRRLEKDFVLPPFGVTTEYAAIPHADCGHPDCQAPARTYGAYITNFGQQLQAAMLGFTGLRVVPSVEPEDWAAGLAALPEGWESVRIGRITLAGQRCAVQATHGRRARVVCA